MEEWILIIIIDKSIIFKNKEAEDKNYDYSDNIIFKNKEAEEEALDKIKKRRKIRYNIFL